MTCIVGIEHRYGTTLAADALGSNGWWGEAYERKKIVTNGPLMIAGTGSYRDIDVMEHVLEVPDHFNPDVSVAQWLARDLAKAMINALTTAKAMNGDGPVEMESRFLIAYRGRLYPMWEQFAIVQPREVVPGVRFAAFGSGGEHAWTYLKTALETAPNKTKGYGVPDFEHVATRAIHAASDRVLSVGGEVQVETQEKA